MQFAAARVNLPTLIIVTAKRFTHSHKSHGLQYKQLECGPMPNVTDGRPAEHRWRSVERG